MREKHDPFGRRTRLPRRGQSTRSSTRESAPIRATRGPRVKNLMVKLGHSRNDSVETRTTVLLLPILPGRAGGTTPGVRFGVIRCSCSGGSERACNRVSGNGTGSGEPVGSETSRPVPTLSLRHNAQSSRSLCRQTPRLESDVDGRRACRALARLLRQPWLRAWRPPSDIRGGD